MKKKTPKLKRPLYIYAFASKKEFKGKMEDFGKEKWKRVAMLVNVDAIYRQKDIESLGGEIVRLLLEKTYKIKYNWDEKENTKTNTEY